MLRFFHDFYYLFVFPENGFAVRDLFLHTFSTNKYRIFMARLYLIFFLQINNTAIFQPVPNSSCRKKVKNRKKRRWRDLVAYLTKNDRRWMTTCGHGRKNTQKFAFVCAYIPQGNWMRNITAIDCATGFWGRVCVFAFTWVRWRWPRPD